MHAILIAYQISFPAKERKLPLPRLVIVTQDIDVAVFRAYFEITILTPYPAIHDLYDVDRMSAEVEALRGFFTSVAFQTFHANIVDGAFLGSRF